MMKKVLLTGTNGFIGRHVIPFLVKLGYEVYAAFYPNDSSLNEGKNSLQEIVSQFSKQTGVSSAWGRIFFLYGPYEAKIRLIPSNIISLLQNQPARCTHGNQIRGFLHVEDVASAFVSLLESNIEVPINIASGQPIALKTVVKQIATYLKQLDLLELGSIPVPDNEPSLLVANVERLTKEVGWTPHYTLNEGLMQTIEWWRNTLYV